MVQESTFSHKVSKLLHPKNIYGTIVYEIISLRYKGVWQFYSFYFFMYLIIFKSSFYRASVSKCPLDKTASLFINHHIYGTSFSFIITLSCLISHNISQLSFLLWLYPFIATLWIFFHFRPTPKNVSIVTYLTPTPTKNLLEISTPLLVIAPPPHPTY